MAIYFAVGILSEYFIQEISPPYVLKIPNRNEKPET